MTLDDNSVPESDTANNDVENTETKDANRSRKRANDGQEESPEMLGGPCEETCGCSSKHCNGRHEYGMNIPPFVEFATGPVQYDGEKEYELGEAFDPAVDEADFAAAIKRNRLAGWTAQNMRYFIMRLSDTGNVHQVCRELGLSRQSAYMLRRRNETFRLAWEGATLRSRDSLVDECWQRAYRPHQEVVMIDGKRVIREGKADNAMLRYLLTRADKLANNASDAARPAHEAEMRLEELVDCIDPDRAAPEDDIADEQELLEEIVASGREKEPSHPPTPAGPMGFESNEAALDALATYKRLSGMDPQDIDTSDLDPKEHESWTDEQWLRADLSGVSEQIVWDEADFTEEDDCSVPSRAV